MPNILVTTLGLTWQIVPELIGFTNPDLIDLYRFHPHAKTLRELRRKWNIAPVEHLWVITTESEDIAKFLDPLSQWHALLKPADGLKLKVFHVTGLKDLNSEKDCLDMKEAIFRVVLQASEQTDGDGGKLLLSLAGGRKTMSSDMQTAASLFGCHALLHVIDQPSPGQWLKNADPEEFTRPFPEFWFKASAIVTPIVVGSAPPNVLLKKDIAGFSALRGIDFPMSGNENAFSHSLRIESHSLVNAVEERLKRSAYLTVNYSHQLMEADRGTNFLALYHLPPQTIEKLQKIRIGAHPNRENQELKWLRKLPKTELHCHLGGVLDASDLIRVAEACSREIVPYRSELAAWVARLDRLCLLPSEPDSAQTIDFKTLPFPSSIPRQWCMVALILHLAKSPDCIESLIYGNWLKPDCFHGIGFSAYERLGNIQGSSLLLHPVPIRETCVILIEKAKAHNVCCLEVRCSPNKYACNGFSGKTVARIIADELQASGIETTMILTASRHGSMEEMEQTISLAGALLENNSGITVFRGFDLAGNEQARKPAHVRGLLLPLMEHCLHVTIHAGEGTPADSIWEAVYHLNAERIGHGLTLKDRPELLKRFLDRNIAVEMCPSSNMQIVGYRDNFLPGTGMDREYPLKHYLDAGIRVTVNTDNPGISRTDFTRELHRAARLTPGGLSLWDILRLVRNGFKSAFVDRTIRNELLRKAESRIIDMILEEPWP